MQRELKSCTFAVIGQSVTHPIPNLFFSLLRRPFCVLVQVIIFCLRDRDHVGLLWYECLNYFPIVYCHFCIMDHAECYLHGPRAAESFSCIVKRRLCVSTLVPLAMEVEGKHHAKHGDGSMVPIWNTLDDGRVERLTLVRTELGRWVGGIHPENPGNASGRP